MRPGARSILWIAGLLAAAPACFPAQQTQAAERRSSGAAKTSDPFLSGAPFTLDQVLHLIGQDAIPLRRRKEAIQSRGVDFPVSPEIIERLKTAGASDDLLELIKDKAKPAPQPKASKPAPVGNLSLNCAPAECDISVNGRARGSTANGALELTGLAAGRWVIDFSKNGYVSRQAAVVVEGNRTATASAVLEPDRDSRQAFGAELFLKMIRAFGGEEGLKELGAVQATGSATTWTRDGNSIRWSLRMRNRSDRALFQAKAGNVTQEVMFTGNKFTASKSLKGQDALELPADFGFIRDYQLAALVARLEQPQYKMLANPAAPASGEEFVLFAEGGADKISIGLDSERRPQRVRITTETGVGSVLVTYSDYSQTGKSAYPKTMQVTPDGQQHGIEVRFDTVELNPKLKDGDYKLKSRFLSNLYN